MRNEVVLFAGDGFSYFAPYVRLWRVIKKNVNPADRCSAGVLYRYPKRWFCFRFGRSWQEDAREMELKTGDVEVPVSRTIKKLTEVFSEEKIPVRDEKISLRLEGHQGKLLKVESKEP